MAAAGLRGLVSSSLTYRHGSIPQLIAQVSCARQAVP